MKTAIRAVVFDLDGTLVDSRADLAESMNVALTRYGFATHSEEAIGTFVGDGVRHLVSRAARLDEADPQFVSLLETFTEHYGRHCAEKTRLMPGALHAMTHLERLPLAILTNKPRDPTEAILVALGQRRRFTVIVAGGDLPFLKPDPRPLQHVAQCLGLSAAQVVMVGDGPQDVECGQACGAKTIGVKGGIAALNCLISSQPDILIESLYELPEAVASLGAVNA